MEQAFLCSVCNEVYDEKEHLPKSLPCGHTYCQQCLKDIFTRGGRLICPNCNSIIWEGLETVPRNQVVLDLLHGLAISCKRHEANASEFCVNHIVPKCDSCTDHSKCQVKAVVENSQEINNLVYTKIKELGDRLERQSPLPPFTKQKIGGRFQKSLRENVDLLLDLEVLLTQLICTSCNRPADRGIDLSSLNAICKECCTDDPDNTYILPFEKHTPQELISKVIERCLILVRDVNFCDLPENFYQVFAEPQNSSLKEVQELGQHLLQLASSPRKGYESLPQTFTCPECRCLKDKASTSLRVLPCAKLHAICATCSSEKEAQFPYRCPLDGNIYGKRLTEMQLMEPPRAPVIPTLDSLLPKSGLKFGPAPGNYQFQPINPGPNQRYQIPQPDPRPVDVIQRPGPPITHLVGTPLPEYQVPQGVFFLNRFPSVLPVLGLPEGQYTSNMRPWSIHLDMIQVEAMTFSCADNVHLLGIGLANPIQANVIGTVEYIKIYAGATGRGNPIFQHANNDQLIGGNSMLTYIMFREPYTIRASVASTMKLKINGPPGQRGTMPVYRGNPFERPDLWFGSNGSLWEFSDMQEVEPGEIINGQNNLTGPILRFIYTS